MMENDVEGGELVDTKGVGTPNSSIDGSIDDSETESVVTMTDPIMRIPNEVWVLILSQLTQKELVQLRTVWKKFREVIDEHFDFTVIVHDGKTDLDRVYELRIRDCLITRLLRDDKEIFQYPAIVRRIRFWGPINPNCFQRIMCRVDSVEELSLTKFALMQDDLVGERFLSGFSSIKKLELLGYMCKDESQTVARNSLRIFSYTMPLLEKLTVNFHCDVASLNRIALSFLDFVSRHTGLKNMQVSLAPEANHPNESIASRTITVSVPSEVEKLLTRIKLNMLRITTATKDLAFWTVLLNAQTHLQDLRMHLSEGGLLTSLGGYVVGIPYDMVKAPLHQNAKTLTSIELKDLRLSPVAGSVADATPLDASIFRYATNLKRLVLYRNTDDYRKFPQYTYQPNIINLKMIPTGIEVLEICRFYCLSEDLQFVVDVLENLKTIQLLHTGSITRLGVHGGHIESIASKPDIQSMNITPLNFYCSTENKKFDKVKQKFQMNHGDHVYYDFDRFRNGLPQPRPPAVGSGETPQDRRRTGRPISVNDTVACRQWGWGRPFEFSSRRRTRPTRAVNQHYFEQYTRHLNQLRLQRCHCDIRENHDHDECASVLFHSLDLHISGEQRCMTEAYSNSGCASLRTRRYSGDGMLLDILKKSNA